MRGVGVFFAANQARDSRKIKSIVSNASKPDIILTSILPQEENRTQTAPAPSKVVNPHCNVATAPNVVKSHAARKAQQCSFLMQTELSNCGLKLTSQVTSGQSQHEIFVTFMQNTEYTVVL